MLTSDTRLLTTHAGSLPRPAALAALHGRRSRGEAVDDDELAGAVAAATAAAIEAQRAAGIDVGNDGEQARESFVTYVQHRMTGFGGAGRRHLMRDLREHPDFLELVLPRRERMQVDLMAAPAAVADVTYRDTSELDAECALVDGAPFAETFMTAASPGIVASAMENRHYPSTAEYVGAVAGALRTEYEAIVERGLLLQIDAPDLALERHTMFATAPLTEFLDWVALVVAAINDALTTVDPSRVRLHVCWGNYEGPHTHDVPLDDILPLLYEARVGALGALDGQRPPRPRAPLLRPPPAARRQGPRRRRHRHDEQLRRASGGGGRAARADRRRRRRPGTHHRRHRLRFRHHRRDRRRRTVGGVGEAAGAAGRSRPRLGPALRRGGVNELGPLPPSFAATREALRAVACYVVGPWRRIRTGRIGLQPFDGGFATPVLDDGTRLGVVGDELVRAPGDRHRLTTLAAAADWAGVELSADPGVGHDLPPLEPHEELGVDVAASEALGRWYAFGREVLDALPPNGVTVGEAQLWPEHFDLALVAEAPGRGDVNLGCSPGDGYLDQPYVYVGPHDRSGLDGDYWNAPFGAVLSHAELTAAPDPHAGAVGFVVTGMHLAAARGERQPTSSRN